MTGFWRGCEMNWVSYPGRRSWRASRNSKRARWPTLIGRNGARATARKENKRRQPKRSAAPPIKGAAEIINKKKTPIKRDRRSRSSFVAFISVASSLLLATALLFWFFAFFLPSFYPKKAMARDRPNIRVPFLFLDEITVKPGKRN